MAYTAQELIRLLQGERDACMNGERLKLSATTTEFSEEAEAILATKGRGLSYLNLPTRIPSIFVRGEDLSLTGGQV